MEKISDVEVYLRHSWIWVLVLLAGAIAWAIYMYRSETELTVRRRKFMGFCQVLAALLFIVMLSEPVMKMKITRPLRRTVLVLLDTSSSMSIDDERTDVDDVAEAAKALQEVPLTEEVSEAKAESLRNKVLGASRLDLARAAIKHPEIDLAGNLGKEYQLRFFSFDDNLRPIVGEGESAEWLDKRRAEGKTSRVGSAIEEAVGRHTGQPMAGVVVLSDFAWIKGRDPADVARRMKERGVPVFPVAIGLPSPPDIHVRRLVAPDVVFAGDKVPLRIQLDSSGFDGRTVELLLTVDGDTAIATDVVLSGGSQFEEMMYIPKKKDGTAELKVEIEPQAGETAEDNNSISHKVRIIDEKIDVLYVEGLPRWEYRYLRWVLLRDPRLNVKFLMTKGDPSLAAASPRYIDKFPESSEAVLSHDLLIIGDVPANYFNSKQISLIEELVKKGGGSVLMLAGPVSAPATYRHSPIAEMLPVMIAGGPGVDPGLKAHPVVTPEGQNSSVITLSASRKVDSRLWSTVRPLGVLPKLDGAKPGAEVLLSLPKLESDALAYPLVAWQRYGKGKTMYVGTENLWRLRREVGDKYHARFWGQAIQFLSLSRLLGDNKQITLETSRKSYAAGEQVNVFANVLTESFDPVEQPAYEVLLEKSGSATLPVELELVPVPDTPGFYSGSYLADEEGSYQLRAKPNDQPVANTVEFDVKIVPLEKRETGSRPDVAEQVAAGSGGKSFSLSGLAGLPEELKNEEKLTTVVHKEKDMWDLPAMFILLVIITGTEWYMRRRDNLV